MSLKLRGIDAATVCPMLPDGAVDQASLERHLGAMSATAGLTGLLINGAPLPPLPDAELAMLRRALADAGLA